MRGEPWLGGIAVPELPEIEALREVLAENLVGKSPESASVRQFALVKTFRPSLDDLVGLNCTGVGRHGKHLLVHFEDAITVAIHLGIGGRLLLGEPGAKRKPGRATSLTLVWNDGRQLDVAELGSKKRSSVHVLGPDDLTAHLSALGVDALDPDLTVERLQYLLEHQRAQLKHFLVDQHRIAGIGNAYSDEVLWAAQLAPLRVTTTLTNAEVARLHTAIGEVLGAALARARSENYLMVARGDKRGSFSAHRREGQPCPRCGGAIASIHFAENSLQYCPACQVEGRQYADRRFSRLLR
jgi:formamidopyrimidine-DNA glycosylase